ncbi:hypothetical protein B0G80_8968 [Paraburkholderia sp. BL6669N2]|uniref:hypothetical protein n=1 Tax=Paraburkholderia sp. BL6669N2 TaxID=1938807 RepID=UPI000E381A58|nr:hypothetical protein [Paraburkholderia sp. BL6669N2]REG52419.1 hypothetical protein B0G80_8968 [Paraburkholderia sp. BL6669N2]
MGHRHQRGEAVFGGPVIRPVENANLSGVVIGAPTQVHRAGIGALKPRFAWNFNGNPALTPEETRREQVKDEGDPALHLPSTYRARKTNIPAAWIAACVALLLSPPTVLARDEKPGIAFSEIDPDAPSQAIRT